jgi:hypothetical protein
MRNQLHRRRWITGPAIALAAVLAPVATAAPASANPPPPGTGVVTGTVSSTGVPLTPPPPGTVNCTSAVSVIPKTTVTTIPFSGLASGFTFNATLITGTVNVGDDIAAGTVNVVATGTGCDSADFGHGTVTATCGASTGVIVADLDNPTEVGSPATIGCNLTGSYDRIGTTVYVNLSGSLTIRETLTGEVETDNAAKVEVVAEFIPAGPPVPGPCAGYPACAFTAVFAGTYVQTA